jgi:predicted ATPase
LDQLFLKNVRLSPGDDEAQAATGFPFDLPIVRQLDLELTTPVTFLVGENGCGKSTLMEATAMALGAVVLGSHDLAHDPTLEHARLLARHLRLARGPRRPRTTLFFRAEDAFGYTQRLQVDMSQLQQLEQSFEEDFADGSWGQRLAMGTARGQRAALEKRYGQNPDAASHGETFLHLLQERITGSGLFLLDEPETPLSPLRILALLAQLAGAVEDGCQFLIATHSPMLMALPGARILQLSDQGMEDVAWQDAEHVRLTRSFLDDPNRYLKHLLD